MGDLRTLARVGENHLLEAIDEAVGAHLVQDLPGGKERYQFSHALIQQTLVGEWTASRRVRLHARIGAALEELYGEEVEAHSAELAYHYTAAEPVVGPAKLVRYSMLAGERALATYAYEEALNHYRRALAARGIDPGSSERAQDAEAAALLFGLGCAQGAFVTRDMGQQAIDMLGRAHPPSHPPSHPPFHHPSHHPSHPPSHHPQVSLPQSLPRIRLAMLWWLSASPAAPPPPSNPPFGFGQLVDPACLVGIAGAGSVKKAPLTLSTTGRKAWYTSKGKPRHPSSGKRPRSPIYCLAESMGRRQLPIHLTL